METIKEEKKADLEQLLNSLIEKEWKPRGIKVNKILNLGEGKIIFIAHGKENFSKLRFLTVKESGLWQFVCDNGMVKTNGYCSGWAYHDEYDDYNDGTGIYDEEMLPRYYDNEFQYYIIESSLKDESELEDFLLNSIKLD